MGASPRGSVLKRSKRARSLRVTSPRCSAANTRNATPMATPNQSRGRRRRSPSPAGRNSRALQFVGGDARVARAAASGVVTACSLFPVMDRPKLRAGADGGGPTWFWRTVRRRNPTREGAAVPRVEPVPYEDLSDQYRTMIEAGADSGAFTTPIPLQI